MSFASVTDTHQFPDTISAGDVVEITLTVNGKDVRKYTKEIVEAPKTNGRIYAKLIIQEGE